MPDELYDEPLPDIAVTPRTDCIFGVVIGFNATKAARTNEGFHSIEITITDRAMKTLP
jgi:hypothetical protein